MYFQSVKSAVFIFLFIASPSSRAQEAIIFPAEVPATSLTVSARIGLPLREAQLLLGKEDAKRALEIVNELADLDNTTPQEQYMIARVQTVAAGAVKDYAVAESAMRLMLKSGFLPATEEDKFIESLASIYAWRDAHGLAMALLSGYLEGKDKPQLQKLLLESRLANKKNISATKTLSEKIAQADRAGATVTHAEVRQLTHLCNVTENLSCYEVFLERLANLDPDWTFRKDLLSGLGRKYGGSRRLQLELYRLELRQNPLTPFNLVMFARLLAGTGAPAEAVNLVERGFNEKILGKGSEAPRHARLRDFVGLQLVEAKGKRNAEYDEALRLRQFDKIATLGFDLVHGGETEKGLAMMTQAIASGQLKDLDVATLHYGVALAITGQERRAIEVLKTVSGSGGFAELARYWTLQITKPARYVLQ